MRPIRPKTPRKVASKYKSSVKDPIVVYCRIRPLDNINDDICIKAKDDKTVVLYQPELSQSSRVLKEIHYSFHHVFNEQTSQKELFDEVALPLVQDVLQGYNGLLFTYGITSSGKTYTMTGTPQDGGLLPRSLDVIFNSIKDFQANKFVFKPDKANGFEIQSTTDALCEQQRELLGMINRTKSKRREGAGEWSCRNADSTIIEDVPSDMNFAVFVSYVEIYNNYVYDLLDDKMIDPKKKTLNSKMLREDSSHNMYVMNVVESEVKTVEEALELFYKGQLHRRVANTALNSESSRSHSVFTIRVVQAPLDPQGAEVLQDKDQVIVSQLSLVDLAGSERQLRTRNTGNKLKEAGNINASLMQLRKCIEILRESQTQGATQMVPYRESKLTHLFKTFFEGEGKIRMIVCVNPRADDYDEATHVMRFAEMTQDVLISRPTPVSTPNVLSLKSGRGNLYREAAKKAREQGVSVSEIIAPAVYTLGPDFPELSDPSFDESLYTNLIEFLDNRIARRNCFVQDLSRRHDDFRRNLIKVDKENAHLKQEKTVLQMDLDAREQQVRGLERKLSSAEQTNDILGKQLLETQNEVDSVRMQLENKDKRLSDQGREVDQVKAQMKEKLASEKDRLRRIMERRLAAKQAELERKMCLTGEKFRQLREILNADDWEYIWDAAAPPAPPSVISTETSESSTPITRRSKRRSLEDHSATEVKMPKTRSAIEFVHNKQNTPLSSVQASRNHFETLFAKENKPPSSSQRSVAIANLRHRRSKSSTSDAWVEHKPIGNLELNTVLQPTLKKKKSVTKLTVKDVTNNAKYVLQHQEQDSQGELETQLFKADIIPSAGGGAQVVFNDVEKLRQSSPPSSYNLRKRSGDAVPLREIEEKCSVSVECHGLPSKVQKRK